MKLYPNWSKAKGQLRPESHNPFTCLCLCLSALLCPRNLCARQLNREYAFNASNTRPQIESINFCDCLLLSGPSTGPDHVRVHPSVCPSVLLHCVYSSGSIMRANRIYCYLIINHSSRASCHAWSLQGAHDLGQITAWPRRRRRRSIRRGGV